MEPEPHPYRADFSGTLLWGCTISAIRSIDTIRPANMALHKELMSAPVE